MDESTSNKRRRLDPETSIQGEEPDNPLIVHEDELPRFFLDEDEDNVTEKRPEPADQDLRSASPSILSSKPISRPKVAYAAHPQPNGEPHICPICSRTFETDNQGLNAHIDWCLSKSLIKETQTAAAISGGKRRR